MVSGILLRGRRHRQKRKLTRRQTTTADLTLEQARDLCALSGPWAIVAEYGMQPELSLPEIADRFARSAYNGDAAVQAAAKAGAEAGFKDWLAGHPDEPYD